MIKLYTSFIKKIFFGVFLLSLIGTAQATLLHLRCGYYLAASGDIAWHNNMLFRGHDGKFKKFFYDIGQGTNVSAGILCKRWRYELEGSYRKNDLKRYSTHVLSEKAAGFARDFALMGNIYWDILLPNSWWVIYVGGGAGVSFHRREVAAKKIPFESTDNNLFAWQAMVGVSYEIIEGAFLNLGYRLFMTAKPRFSQKFKEANTIVWANNIELGTRIEF